MIPFVSSITSRLGCQNHASKRAILPSRSAWAILTAIILTPCLSLLAMESPSKPFLDKNSFYLSSAGFKVHFANDAAGKKALHALPPHRFGIITLAGVTSGTSMPSHSIVYASSSAPRTLIKAIAPFSPSQCRNPTMSPRITRRRLARCWKAILSNGGKSPLCRRIFPQLLLGGLRCHQVTAFSKSA